MLFLTGSASEDTFDVAGRNFFGTPSGDVFAHIEHEGDAFSDVEVEFGQAAKGDPRIMTIRLTGTTGVTADQILLR